MRGSEFVFNYVHLLYYKCYKIILNHGGSYIDSKATTNPISKKGNKCFQYAVTVALSHEEIKNDPQRKTKIKPFINKCSWEGINFPSEIDDWKKCEKII